MYWKLLKFPSKTWNHVLHFSFVLIHLKIICTLHEGGGGNVSRCMK